MRKEEIACKCFKKTGGKRRNYSLPTDKILHWSKWKAFADDKISVNEKLKFGLGRVENVGKGENAGCQHFLLFPQHFQKAPSWSLKVGILWYLFPECFLPFPNQISTFHLQRVKEKVPERGSKTPTQNTVGKGENTGNQLLFPQCFLPLSDTNPIILAISHLSSANTLKFDKSKTLLFHKGINIYANQ